ncbi:MAG: porin, partial [Flavobacteriales bacterium]|nr:porin [Flavobacteriales bacterium]
MNLAKRVLLLFFLVLVILTDLLAQNKLKFNFDDSGTTYVKFSARMTAWARITDLNPGTVINSEQRDYFPDFSFRRLRFNVSSQITPKLFFNLSFGGNNMNHLTTKSFVFRVLDAHADYEFAKSFAIGAGKSSWQGGSRWEIRSSKTLMGLDAPLYSLSTV